MESYLNSIHQKILKSLYALGHLRNSSLTAYESLIQTSWGKSFSPDYGLPEGRLYPREGDGEIKNLQ